MLILTPEQIRKAEQDANGNGLSYAEMMENAGRGCARHIQNNYAPCKTVVLCGRGKNGGDGYVIARYLHLAGFAVSLCNVFDGETDSLSASMRAQLPSDIQQADLQDLQQAEIIIDAVFGIGFHGQMPETVATWLQAANQTQAARIAIDVPSGLNTDHCDGKPYFHADETLTMLCYKPVHAYKPFASLCGKITVIPIGFGVDTIDPALKTTNLTQDGDIAAMFKKRPYNAHKGSNGHALLLMGSRNMPGAAVMACKGALSSGAGLVTLAFPDAAYNAVTAHLTECILQPLKSDANGSLAAENAQYLAAVCNNYTCIAVGCGLTQEKGAEECLLALLKNYTGKLLIDADGINILSRHIDCMSRSKAELILTPHPGEMARLTDTSIPTVNAAREEYARQFAVSHNCTLVLKGANTVVADKNGNVFINPTGNPGMARGGSGDLLAGMSAALLAQGLSALDAARAGVYLHGLCGDIAAEQYTEYAATVARMTDCIPQAFSRLING
ncbi:MAG: NAD(P)H-hydrate dehydratase [Clostridia bacterium]|nr:NAD(P)H-hydrate dehydratase [Clostridia bacterium]